MSARRSRLWPWLALAVTCALTIAVLTMCALPVPAHASSPAPATARPADQPIPLLAYYYIWYDHASWQRAKTDYPLLGRYSSDDAAVMRRQVSLAQRAGISGFLVSWKDTAVLDHRLDAIVKVSADAGFKLGIVFEGLDFGRDPLAMQEVDRSFHYFASHYAQDPVFDLFGKPLVIWSGTWEYSREEIASITRVYGPQLSILATEKQLDSYEAVARFFDGNAYYWSSGDPLSTPGYREKLRAFSAVVHGHRSSHPVSTETQEELGDLLGRDPTEADGGLWIAPAAPGYDATALGGSRIVPRRDGDTLRVAMNAAMDSSPDAVGLISWNEYSENTMVEPSRIYGSAALKTIATIQGAEPPAIPDFDSSAPSGSTAGRGAFGLGSYQIAILAASILVLAACTGIVVRRTRHREE